MQDASTAYGLRCRRRSQDGREAVLDANQRFYDAFQSCDPQVLPVMSAMSLLLAPN
jgi:hypothetical protein